MTDSTKQKLIDFLQDLLHPEGYGWAVSVEVRRHAREILTMIESESNDEQDSTIRPTI